MLRVSLILPVAAICLLSTESQRAASWVLGNPIPLPRAHKRTLAAVQVRLQTPSALVIGEPRG
jgi:hypothetical protein